MTSTTLLAASKRTRRSLAWLWPIGGLALLIATLGLGAVWIMIR